MLQKVTNSLEYNHPANRYVLFRLQYAILNDAFVWLNLKLEDVLEGNMCVENSVLKK